MMDLKCQAYPYNRHVGGPRQARLNFKQYESAKTDEGESPRFFLPVDTLERGVLSFNFREVSLPDR